LVEDFLLVVMPAVLAPHAVSSTPAISPAPNRAHVRREMMGINNLPFLCDEAGDLCVCACAPVVT
jgi:hypothetical protein